MKTTKQTFKNTISLILSFVLLMLSGIGIINLTKSAKIAYASNIIGASSKEISNSNFNDDSRTSYPYSPSSFNYVDRSFNSVTYNPSTDNQNSTLQAGVISLEHKDYEGSYPINPHANDKQVLMIKNSATTPAVFGVQSTTELELKAGCNYSISADVYTTVDSGNASLYLVDENNNVFADFINISSFQQWRTFNFFIKTNPTETKKVKLALFLEGEGSVLFDNLSAYELNDETFVSRQNDYAANQNKTLNLETGYIEETIAISSNTFSSVGSSENITSTLENNILADGEIPNGENNSSALKVQATAAANAVFETDNNFLTFEQNRVYKVTVSLKSKSLKGKINLKLVQTNLENEETGVNSEELSISNPTSSAIYNNYQNFSFVVKSHPTKTLTYKLQVAFALEGACSTYVSQIQISKANNSTFSSTDSYTKALDLTKNLVASASDIMLDNGNFNGIEIENTLNPYPAKASSWTAVEGNNLQYHGVVNTSQFNELKNGKTFVQLINPGSMSGSTNNNLLMMYNSTADSLSYTSSAKSVDAKTYHKFSLNLLTQNAAAKVSLVSSNNNTETVLTSKTINTNSIWQKVDFIVYTGYQSQNIALKIELNTTAFGYAYVDDCMFNYYTQPSSLEDFSSADVIVRTDLSQLIQSENNSNKAFKDAPLHFTVKNENNIEYGVMNLDANYISTIINPAMSISSFTSLTNRNILGVRAIDYANFTFTSNIGYELTAGNYYILKVKVYTQNLESENEELTGAIIKLTNFEHQFANIVTESEESNNWQTYTFYINPKDKVTTNLCLQLGNDTTLTKGDVFFGDIEFTELEEGENFDNVVENETSKILTDTTLDSNKENDKEDNSDENKSSSNNAWIFYIPTILTALAIVIAVVGVTLRKVKFKKPVKKSKTEYDRNKTVSKQACERRATMFKENKLRELNKELETLHNDRAKYEEEYKHNLAKLRELKIKRANAKEIAALEKDMKKNQKITSSIGMNVLKVEADIAHVKSDAYFKALVRKMSTEPTFGQDQNSAEESSKNS